MLQVCRRAQFTFAHLLHCQSSALNKPRDFSAAAFPISVPSFFFDEPPPPPPLPATAPPAEAAVPPLLLPPTPGTLAMLPTISGRSRWHLLQWVRRPKFTFLHLDC